MPVFFCLEIGIFFCRHPELVDRLPELVDRHPELVSGPN